MELARRNPHWRVINLNALSVERYEWALEADLLVVIQSLDTDLIPILEKRKALGKKTLVEYNDHFYEPQAWSPVATVWNSPLVWQSYELFMEKSDGLLVTGPGLVDLFRSKGFTLPIHILENHLLDDPTDENVLKGFKNKNLTIGWAGSLGHIADLLSVAPFFHQWLRDFPDLQISLMGNNSIPNLLRLPESRFQFKEWSNLKEYLEFWKSIHIGIAPLLPTPYNHCRSDIKAVEMSSQLTLPVLQNEKIYSKFIENTNCPRFSNFNELDKIIREICNNPKSLSSVSSSYHYVKTERVHRLRSERSDLYEKHFPETLHDAFPWPMGPGYHEWTKSLDNVTPSQQRLMQIQRIWSVQKETALSEIEKALEAEPYDQDLALTYCQSLSKLQVAPFQTLKVVETFIKRFKRNIRFRLLKIQLLSDPQMKLDEWGHLVERMKEVSKNETSFFLNQIIFILKKQMKTQPELLSVAEEIHCLFPKKASVRHLLAEQYEEREEYAKAYQHYLWLREQKEFQSEQKFQPLHLELYYLEAWVAALEARVDS